MRREIIGLLTVLALVFAACSESTGSDTTTAAITAATTAPSGGGESGGDAANGRSIYTVSCGACHGPNAEGVSGLGKPFVGSDFINGLSDDELLAFINTGRPADDPANTTGIAMMPKGGNPSLSDEDILDIVAWIRTIN